MNKTEDMLQKFMCHARNGGEFIIFDTETTGFSASKDRILSFSAIKATFDVDTCRFVEISRLDQYINPERRISAEITKITGIDYNRIKNEPVEEEAAIKIACFLGSHPYVVGQNIGFDIKFVTAMAKRCEFSFNLVGVADTLALAKKIIGTRSENHKLETLMKFFAIKRDDLRFHESISDVIATSRVMEQFILLYQDRLDIDKVAAKYKERELNDTGFQQIKKEDTPFFMEESEPNQKKELFKPTIIRLSYWQKYDMKRIYFDTKETGIKIWYDLVTNTFQSKFEWNGNYGEIDWDYVKTVTAKMLNQPQYQSICNKIQEAQKKKGTR